MRKAIDFIDFTRESAQLRPALRRAFENVLRSGRYVLGTEVRQFEAAFARYCGTKYCVGVNSGTDALYLSLLAFGIGAGDEVIVPVNTAIPTAVAVLMTGATPVFVDCDDFLLDLREVSAALTPKTKAVIAVHLYGQACDLQALRRLTRLRRIYLIEDCAQANGAAWQGKKVGGWGDAGCFSFYPTKNLGACGDGGAITTNRKQVYERLLQLRFYGQKSRTESVTFGVNSRLDELQAALLRVKLKKLDTWNKRRQRIAELYRASIDNPLITLPSGAAAGSHVYHLFVIKTKHRDALQRFLQKNGIETLVHYPLPLHKQIAFRSYSQKPFPGAEASAREILSLPLYPFLQDSEVRRIAAVINTFQI